MSPNESTEAREVAYNRAVGAFLLRKLRTAPPAVFTSARRPKEAARALASVEAVLLEMTEGVSLEEALAGRTKDEQNVPTVEVFDRDDVTEFRALARESQAHHRGMAASLRAGRANIIAHAEDASEANRWVTQSIAHHIEAEQAAAAEVARYDALLASADSSWRFELLPS